MGDLSVSNIAARVRRQFGDEAGILLTEGAFVDWVNDAMKEIVLQNDLLRWRSTATSTIGQANYAVPDDLLRFHSLTHDGEALREISLQEAQRTVPNIDDTANYTRGVPQSFWQYGDEFFIWPAPALAKSLVIYYNRKPTPVVNLASTPELNARYDNRLVEYCLAQAAELDNDDDRAALKMNQFQGGLDRTQDEEVDSGMYPHMNVPLVDSSGYYYDY
jgi:hypothetical protein